MRPLAIMVVEDDPSLCRLMSSELGRLGMEAHCFSTTENAIVGLGEQRWDALIVDIVLPGSSGLYMVEALKKLGVNPKPPVIIVTGARGETLKLIDRTVVKGIIFKPVDVKAVAAFIAVLAAAAREQQPAEA